MDSAFCIDALEAALHTGTPEIFNTDQGSQFTSVAFTDRIRAAGARCSMDGRSRYLDNIFIERLWRSLKYESVYLHELSDGRDAERVIDAWFDFYNNVRPHSSLDGRTPGDVYRGTLGEAAWTTRDPYVPGTPRQSPRQAATRFLHFVPAFRVTRQLPWRSG